MDWKKLLAYITGSVDQELLLRNEYLAAENRILRNQLKRRLRLTDGERQTLAEIGKRLGKKALEGEVSKERMPLEPHPLRRKVSSTRPEGVRHTSPPREESPR